MIKKCKILYILILVLLISCNWEIKKKSNDFETLVSDTTVTHDSYNEIEFSRRMSSLLNLSTIYNGVDSFELRIWVSNIIIPKHLTIFRYDKDKWVNYEYWYYPKNEMIDSVHIYNKPIPKDIGKIVTFLNKKEILELPSQSAIPNFQDNTADGQTCTIEIATKHFYKALEYHCPERFTNETNNVKFMSIINYLNPHFKFYVPWCL